MKLQLDRNEGLNTVTGYGDDYVSINGIRHRCNLAVLPDRLILNWTQATAAMLTIGEIEFLAALDADILLLGTGKQLRFPPPALLRPLQGARRGLEVMDVYAACRTYNILLGEGRKVAAGLLLA